MLVDTKIFIYHIYLVIGMCGENEQRKLILLPLVSVLLLFSLSATHIAAAFVPSSIIVTDVTPTELGPGDTREVTITVKNNGGRDARDVKLAFQGTPDVSVVGPTVVQIETLESWASKEVKITVHVRDEAPSGVYSIPVLCSWNEMTTKTITVGYTTQTLPDGSTVTSPITKTEYDFPEPRSAQLGISFSVRGSALINVGSTTTSPTKIKPGDENVEMRVVIENSGQAAAKDIEARLALSDKFTPSWSGTDRSYIGRLNPGEKREAIFYVDVADRIESKTYSIPVHIRYKDTRGDEYEVVREVSVLVGPKPDLEIVSFYTKPGNISSGDEGVELHVRIRNVGSENAESVSVRITGEADVPFDYDVKSDYVGNLKVGEEGEAILKFSVKKSALVKEYLQGIEIRCSGDRDLGDDNVYIFDKQIRLKVSSPGPSVKSLIPGFEAPFGIAIFVVSALLLGRKGREG